ncbi:hypothetical protein RHMOL_Rhmol09G0105400 [Rhododendron molle]|uniref:Uncharacterized protein n=1 Tax=Rhododendron molle TaxID=49168 RepID=A0ACC0MD26_RHOML|nr:hypothetical protein RHMOL_Rhmol09G0105400 [Rhododendron molle]
MMEMIRRQLMNRYEQKRNWITTCNGKLCPKIQNILEELKVEVRGTDVTYSGNFIYEVRVGSKTFICDVDRHTCSCRRWDVTGIPCSHGIAAIVVDKRLPENFVHQYYHMDTYNATYSHFITSIPDETMWVQANYDPIMPPPLRRPSGRPKKARRKAVDEVQNPNHVRKQYQSLRRGKCREFGRNTRTCKGPVKPRNAGHGCFTLSRVRVALFASGLSLDRVSRLVAAVCSMQLAVGSSANGVVVGI